MSYYASNSGLFKSVVSLVVRIITAFLLYLVVFTHILNESLRGYLMLKKRPFLLIILLSLFLLVPYQGQTGMPSSKGTMSITGGYKASTFPIKTYNNLLIIPISINGSIEMDFILDSGSRSTVLTEPALLPMLNIKTSEKKRIAGLGEKGIFEALIAKDITLSLPGIEGTNMELIVLPPDLLSLSEIIGRPVYGIIGYDLFKDLIVEIDYTRKVIRFKDPQYFKKAPKTYKAIPIELHDSKPYLNIRVCGTKGTDETTQLLVDTGSSQALSLSSRLFPPPEPSLPTFIGTGLSGEIHGLLGRIKSIEIGDIIDRQIIACFPDEKSLIVHKRRQWNGSIGGEFLKRFKVIFNYSNNKLYLRKNKDFGSPYPYNISGIETIATGIDYGTIEISYVRPNSAADKAGILVGDELIRINGIGIEGNQLGEIYNFLNKKRSGSLCLKIKRGEKKMKKCFELEDIL